MPDPKTKASKPHFPIGTRKEHKKLREGQFFFNWHPMDDDKGQYTEIMGRYLSPEEFASVPRPLREMNPDLHNLFLQRDTIPAEGRNRGVNAWISPLAMNKIFIPKNKQSEAAMPAGLTKETRIHELLHLANLRGNRAHIPKKGEEKMFSSREGLLQMHKDKRLSELPEEIQTHLVGIILGDTERGLTKKEELRPVAESILGMSKASFSARRAMEGLRSGPSNSFLANTARGWKRFFSEGRF